MYNLYISVKNEVIKNIKLNLFVEEGQRGEFKWHLHLLRLDFIDIYINITIYFLAMKGRYFNELKNEEKKEHALLLLFIYLFIFFFYTFA